MKDMIMNFEDCDFSELTLEQQSEIFNNRTFKNIKFVPIVEDKNHLHEIEKRAKEDR